MARFSMIIVLGLLMLGVAAPRELQPLAEISCTGFTAYEYAANLGSPDGLAINPLDGSLYVAEESAGWITRIDTNGNRTVVLPGLSEPEGITFGADGTLYAVEDVAGGRVVALAPNSTQTTWATGLEYPEGIVWSGGKLFVTESNIEALDLSNPLTELPKLRSQLTEINSPGVVDRTEYQYRSYSGIAAAADGRLYVANEIAGFSYGPFTMTDSIFRGTRASQAVFASGLFAPEGLHFADGGFRLYVAEEQDNQAGRISAVDSNGVASTVCTGFKSVEDVVGDGQGRLFISEDGRNRIVVLVPTTDPTATPVPTPLSERRFTWVPVVRTASN